MTRKKKDAFTDDLERTLLGSIDLHNDADRAVHRYLAMNDVDKADYQTALWERLVEMMAKVGLRPKVVINATGQVELYTEPVD